MENITKKEKAKLLTKSKSWTAEQWEEYLQQDESPDMAESRLPVDFDEETTEDFKVWTGDEKTFEQKKLLESICRNAFKKLTNKQKIIIKLTFYEGLTQEQIAKKFGVSRSSVRNIKNQSLRKLRRLLGPKLGTLYPLIGGGVMEKVIFSFPKNLTCSRNSYEQNPEKPKFKSA